MSRYSRLKAAWAIATGKCGLYIGEGSEVQVSGTVKNGAYIEGTLIVGTLLNNGKIVKQTVELEVIE